MIANTRKGGKFDWFPVVFGIFVFSMGYLYFSTGKHRKGSELKPEKGTYAVLVSGTKGGENYADQANVEAIRDLLLETRVPATNIFVFSHAGGASNMRNRGSIGEKQLTNYQLDNFSWQNIRDTVLRSAVTEPGSKTSHNSRLLFYFSGNGGYRFIQLSNGEMIFTEDLNNLFAEVVKGGKINKILLLIDSDYSGSVIDGIDRSLPVISLASTNFQEERYASDCESYSTVLQCRSTEFTASFLQSIKSGRPNLSTKVLSKSLATAVHGSSVEYFEGFGTQNTTVSEFFHIPSSLMDDFQEDCVDCDQGWRIMSSDIHLEVLANQLMNVDERRIEAAIRSKIEGIRTARLELRNKVVNIGEKILRINAKANSTLTSLLRRNNAITNSHCYRKSVQHYVHKCVRDYKDPFYLQYSFTINNLCGISTRKYINHVISRICVD